MPSEWDVVQNSRKATDEASPARGDRRVLAALDGAADSVLPDAVQLARCLGGSLLPHPPDSRGPSHCGVAFVALGRRTTAGLSGWPGDKRCRPGVQLQLSGTSPLVV